MGIDAFDGLCGFTFRCPGQADAKEAVQQHGGFGPVLVCLEQAHAGLPGLLQYLPGSGGVRSAQRQPDGSRNAPAGQPGSCQDGISAVVAATGHSHDRPVREMLFDMRGNQAGGAVHQGHACLLGPAFQHAQAGSRKNRADRVHSGSPQRGCSWCGRPSWSRMRATTKSTMSATVRGWV